MTGRERIEAAFSRDGAGDLPVVICYESVFVRDHWAQLTSLPWWYPQSPEIMRQEQWMHEIASLIGQDWVQLFPFCSSEERADLPIEERPDGVYRINPTTGEVCKLVPPQVSGWRAEEQVESVRAPELPESFDDVDRLLIEHYGPHIVQEQPYPPNSVIGGARPGLASALVKRLGAALYPCRHISGPFWNTYGLWGFEGMMMLTGTRPDLIKHACDRILARTLVEIREYASHGTAGIWIEECLTDVLSPAAFSQLNEPYIRRLVEEIRSLGMNSIYYFTGNPAGKWDLIASAGADALAFEESKKNFRVDIDEVAGRFAGKCVLLGNLDAVGVLEKGTEGELRAEIGRQMRAGRKNKSRFIMSLGSPVTPETSVERVRLYCELAHEIGKG